MGVSCWPTTKIVGASAAIAEEEGASSAKAVVDVSAAARAIVEDVSEVLSACAPVYLDMF
jgi:hypothetical protein